MNKKLYFVLAIIISIILTLFQTVIINSKNNKNMQTVYIAGKDIEKNTIISEECLLESKIYFEGDINKIDKSDIVNKIALSTISKGEFITMNDIDTSADINDFRYISLKINGDNFNANDIKTYDFVDIYFILDYSKFERYQMEWLVFTLEQCHIEFMFGKDVGLLIKNVQVEYIDMINQSAQYVSIKVISPYDELISFLKISSVYQFVKLNQ